ncbi:MAG: DUF21 domain-containing protein [Gammaproteobacteria bacterium]|nr:DUF21 domain-containing protein [Gammaproteobacteria bacterium]NNM21367.1 DUF21 domain-containing protein [Gammaproteobacteria bacterium]
METFIWIGILACLTQSAMFSGLNLAFFSLSRLRLEAEAGAGNQAAVKILSMRQDSNFLLTTILWGNVSINVLLTLLSNSVLAGVAAFVFSTGVITFAGEIIPQAYFSRNALRMASLFSPVLRFYQFLLYPVARPSALILDKLVGPEELQYFRERQLKKVIEHHIKASHAEVDMVEGIGALNFLDIDDVPVEQEGEEVDPASVLTLPVQVDLPVLPHITRSMNDEFLQQVNASGRKWIIIVDPAGEPRLVLDSDGFLRASLMDNDKPDSYQFCHRPILVRDARRKLGEIILQLRSGMNAADDHAIARDIVLLWTPTTRRVITGADILGRLLRGIPGAAVQHT